MTPRRQAHPNLAEDRASALALTPVSRETADRLDRFVALLLTWQATTQLVATSTVPRLWSRHIADSLQLLDIMPDARTWIDLGSGAGFPGLVLACALAEKPNAHVHLVEANMKKAAFLREAIRVTGAPASVHAERIEAFVQNFRGTPDVITARALAPLKDLLDQSVELFATPDTVGVFPKGQDVGAELTEATKYWSMRTDLIPSRTDPKARIVVVRTLERRSPARQ
jgi:16S rRNA (guanine527-N7)-methyltransferase